MKNKLIALSGLCVLSTALANPENLVEQSMVSEVVYVESPTDTDKDGKKDRIYVSIQRHQSERKLSSLFHISPYALGGNEGPMHNVDMNLLPQDEKVLLRGLPDDILKFFASQKKLTRSSLEKSFKFDIEAPTYARVSAHSLGTGWSTGCPTVGDMSETLAAKAVIEWLNGKAKGFYEDGREAQASWANGNVGMTGTSYDGTLPIMVATTGVEGLKAIIPVAAISNWYDYYRANGLVVNPGGWIGEDADVLGNFIVRKNACQKEMKAITRTMGRENGDFTQFWQDRDYLPLVKNIKAATFIIHGQSDWNVKQKHAIQLWEALEGVAPRRMFLHRGGHSSTSNHGVPAKVNAWFAHFLEGENNGITDGPQVEVELPDGSLIQQEEWPNEDTAEEKLYLAHDGSLSSRSAKVAQMSFTDNGRMEKLEALAMSPEKKVEGRLVFLTNPTDKKMLLSGTPKVSLNLAVMNRKAANITVALVEYDKSGNARVITRGWADPQNYRDMSRGEKLVPGKTYQLNFELEPKQYEIKKGNRLGVLVGSTDYEYTLRPAAGTQVQVTAGAGSFVELRLSSK